MSTVQTVFVVVEARMCVTPDGAVWTLETAFGYHFWRRYLVVFDEVCVVARAKLQATPPANAARVDGDGVRLHPIPHYIGAREFALKAVSVRHALRSILGSAGAIILRVPSALANVLGCHGRYDQRPFGVEVVGDPCDVFRRGVIRHPFRPFFRWWFCHHLRRQCSTAVAVAYVTQHKLQQRYPSGPHTFTAQYSSVELPDAAFASNARSQPTATLVPHVVVVGSLSQPYKGIDVLLEAMSHCKKSNVHFHLTILGDGKLRPTMEEQANRLGLEETVRFLGQVAAGAAVREHLDAADLFVLPSRTEGLPRALLEAMARGLPCIATNVGGIPELLETEDLVEPDQPLGLAAKISTVLKSPTRMSHMSDRNLARAREYRDEVLTERRVEFYQRVRDATTDGHCSRQQTLMPASGGRNLEHSQPS